MRTRRISKSTVAAMVVAGAMATPSALAHGQGYEGGYGPCPMQPGATVPGMGTTCPGAGQGMTGSGMGMMGPGMGMMGPGMGMMSPGMGMMGPGMGMLGPGAGQGTMGPGTAMMGPGAGALRERDVTVDEARDVLEHRLRHHGNDRLRVGRVEATDDDVIVAEIETVDGSLVERYAIDRHTGRIQRSE